MVSVKLAGYNVDRNALEELVKKGTITEDDLNNFLTPETISAAYARISRDPRPINELRADARQEVEKARKSNQAIVFKMGHHSVAEHAVFNFDVIGISRLSIEDVEKFRLCSFTEKSQRYITLENDYVTPKEIKETGQEEIFVSTVQSQNSVYHELYPQLRNYFFEKNAELAKDPAKHSTIEGWAKEDARFVVSFATEGQVGLTMNARNIEHLIRRFASKPLAETREIGTQIYEETKKIAPSLLLFTQANEFDAETYNDLGEKTAALLKNKSVPSYISFLNDQILFSDNQFNLNSKPFVRLVDFTPNGDDKLIAALLHSTSNVPYTACFLVAKNMSQDEKKEYMKTAFKKMDFFDTALREFEYPNLTFELIVSASSFAQLKRHRMATLTTQNYNPALGVTVPDSIKQIGAEKKFMEIINKTHSAYEELKNHTGELVASYVLTNAFRRRVLIEVNARELYHISRFREDAHAQWEIRASAVLMSQLAREVMPLTSMMLGGKHEFPEKYANVFGDEKKSAAWKAAHP